VLTCQLGDLCDAEDALTEANVLNNVEPEVWAYLCLLCLDTERDVEAEQAYKYTLKVHHTVHRLRTLHIHVNFASPQCIMPRADTGSHFVTHYLSDPSLSELTHDPRDPMTHVLRVMIIAYRLHTCCTNSRHLATHN